MKRKKVKGISKREIYKKKEVESRRGKEILKGSRENGLVDIFNVVAKSRERRILKKRRLLKRKKQKKKKKVE